MAGTGIIVTPIYLKLMGPEAYDLGLTPTLARETA
eukprot:gene26295-32858_t